MKILTILVLSCCLWVPTLRAEELATWQKEVDQNLQELKGRKQDYEKRKQEAIEMEQKRLSDKEIYIQQRHKFNQEYEASRKDFVKKQIQEDVREKEGLKLQSQFEKEVQAEEKRMESARKLYQKRMERVEKALANISNIPEMEELDLIDTDEVEDAN